MSAISKIRVGTALLGGTLFGVPIIQANVQEWAKARGYDQLMNKSWEPLVSQLNSYSYAITIIGAFLLGGAAFLWADFFWRAKWAGSQKAEKDRGLIGSKSARREFRDESLDVWELCPRGEFVIEDKIFYNCEFQGPAVVTFRSCDIGITVYTPTSTLDPARIVVPPMEALVGPMIFLNCKFYSCRFYGIGIIGHPQFWIEFDARQRQHPN